MFGSRNGCGNGCGDDFIWIIILLVIVCCLFDNGGCGCNECGCRERC